MVDDLGNRIHKLRRKQSLTLKQLSAATELSVSFLSEIERGLAQPSMASLKKIRKALGISLLNLTTDEGREPAGPPRMDHPALEMSRRIDGPKVVRKSQRKKLAYPDSGFYELLTPDLNRLLEVLYFKMAAGSDTGPEPLMDPPGEKCMVILAGSGLFRIGDEEFLLEAGDSLSYPADAPVSWTVMGREDIEGILIVTPPNF